MKFLYSHRTRAADGQQVHIRALTDALAASGHDVVMAGPDGANEKPLDAKDERGLKALLPGPLYECAEYGYSFPAFLRLMKTAKASRPDILYERYNLFFHAGVWAKRRLGLPMILEVNAPLAEERAAHGHLALKNFARKSEAAIWRAADMALPVSGVLAARLAAAGVPEPRIDVIHNGVEEAFLKPAAGALVRARYGLEEQTVLGFAGFVRDWHGLDRAVRFLVETGREDVALLIVGDGPARPDLERLASELGVSARVHFAGVVQREEMPAHLAAFDIALQPAVTDYASPLKLFEYMAQGRAVLAPDQANIREVLTHGEDALLFPEGGFETALAALAQSGALRQRLGAAARETLIRRDFTWAGNARRVEAIAERLKGTRA
ncbi:glycosyltransferase family 4 protein [Hyphococcus luteus]|uniref:Glycosyltransferase WbuB n=1 Tax=Hyphococcus luteus TaxID=2058213 RepID=A0A2S7K671_9PROT|nr:glycosyltransferase family 4 protein [Marinicaulis flavus]PQA88015.1 glycosyltransferase WbuB [Marinicaulis flavus]